MRIVSINLNVFGSTGRIIDGIHSEAVKKGHKVLTIAPRAEKNNFKTPVYSISSNFYVRMNSYFATATGHDGGFSYLATIKAIKKIKEFKPDIIHLHNLHNSYINIAMLMRYIKKYDIRVIWTLHDCWAFTGHCPHFIMEQCYKWKSGCSKCPRYKLYPKSLFDNSRRMWKKKKEWFCAVNKLTLVTPSKWLRNLVSQSFLNKYPVEIINNGVDLDVFSYTESNFREKYGIGDKKIVLGVSFAWSEKKGLDVFIKLSQLLSEDYRIVLVGTDSVIDQILPKSIISIHKTNNQKELAEIYSAADVFVNPTREDTYPTVNMEAIACGTPVITFDTGGCVETLIEDFGIVVEKDNVEALKEKILSVVPKNAFTQRHYSLVKQKVDKNFKFAEYVNLYEKQI